MVKFEATEKEIKTMQKIVDLATKTLKNYKPINAMMDIEAVHCNGTPLRLDDMLDAGKSTDCNKLMDFYHDITGIWMNINRKTGKLENNFTPRFAKKRRKQ